MQKSGRTRRYLNREKREKRRKKQVKRLFLCKITIRVDGISKKFVWNNVYKNAEKVLLFFEFSCIIVELDVR